MPVFKDYTHCFFQNAFSALSAWGSKVQLKRIAGKRLHLKQVNAGIYCTIT